MTPTQQCAMITLCAVSLAGQALWAWLVWRVARRMR